MTSKKYNTPEEKKAALKAACQRYRKRHPERVKARSRFYWEQKRAYVISCKMQPCADCNKLYPPCCMDFDHVRGVKLFNIVYAVSSKTLDDLKAEIAKCDIVCSNCHRIRTEQRGYFSHLERLANECLSQ